MAIFETKNVTLALDKLIIVKDADRWGGVEPYIVPVFYKIDGERYEAELRIFDVQSPRPDSTERPTDRFIQFNINSIPEDNPFIEIPTGKLLGRGGHESGDKVDISDIFFTTDLQPIPFKIYILGSGDLNQLDRLKDAFVNEGEEVNNAFNIIFLAINDALSGLVGLDETFETCPDVLDNTEDFIKNIESQFDCLFPGTIGGVFVCMENDEFDEGLAKTIQSSVAEEIAKTINDTINDTALNNPIPDPDRFTDIDAIGENVGSDLTWPVISRIGLAIGLTIAGAITYNIPAALIGFVTSLSWLIGGPDDIIGTTQISFDHTSLDKPFDDDEEGEGIKIEGDGNLWRLTGSLTVNQP